MALNALEMMALHAMEERRVVAPAAPLSIIEDSYMDDSAVPNENGGAAYNQIAEGGYESESNPKRGWGTWTPEEDEQIEKLVKNFGTKKWTRVGMFLKRRTGKQCRERWHNHLNPEIRRERWSVVEDETIIREHINRGSRWSEIAKFLPGRTDNAIKNRWNSTMRRVQRHYHAMHSDRPVRVNPPCSKDDGAQLYAYCMHVTRLCIEGTADQWDDQNNYLGGVMQPVEDPTTGGTGVPTLTLPVMPARVSPRNDGFLNLDRGHCRLSIPTAELAVSCSPSSLGGKSFSFLADDTPAQTTMIDERLLGAAHILFQSTMP